MSRIVVGLVSLVLVSGCSSIGSMSIGSLNPFNWGSKSGPEIQEERIAAARSTLASIDDGRSLLPLVSAVAADRTPLGIILRASGPAPGVGYSDAGLRPVRGGRPDDDGVSRFEFVAFPPEGAALPGHEFARTLDVATYLPQSRLRGVKTVVVIAASGERSLRLR